MSILRLLEFDPVALHARFIAAQPFQHVVLDDVIGIDADILVSEFPTADWPYWSRLDDRHQVGKSYCTDVSCMPPICASIMRELSDGRVLDWLGKVSGIGKLLPDPYLAGGGIHLSIGGGVLAPHTDFHHYEELDLYRRLNLLIYLNPNWQESKGGALQLYNERGTAIVRVNPVWGRCIIFRTDNLSTHGFPDPVLDGESRRSIAVYYYTAADAPSFSGDRNTYWRSHDAEQLSLAQKLQLVGYRLCVIASRGASAMAYRLNPGRSQ